MYSIYLKKCLFYAWKNSLSNASTWAGTLGTGLLGGGYQLLGKHFAIQDDWQSTVLIALESSVAAWIAIFVFRLFFVAPYLIYKNFDNSELENTSEPVSIIVGKGKNYEKTRECSNERVNRLLLVGIKNNQSGTFISNCKLYLQHTIIDGSKKEILLSDTFTLQPKEERYIEVVSYNESITQGKQGDANMIFRMSRSGFFSYEHMPTIDKKHIVSLRLEAREDLSITKNCYLWVDEGHLKLDEV